MTKQEIESFYQSDKWKGKRNTIMRRDGYMCQYSKRYGKKIEAEVVHHIFPIEDYPEYALENWNLISLSRTAHNRLHDRSTGQLTAEGKTLAKKVARNRRITLDW